MPAYSSGKVFRRRLAARVAAALAASAFLSCSRQPGAGEDFTLIAESMGDVPMHVDALIIDNLAKAHDGSMATRWTTVGSMEPGYFVEIKFPKRREVTGLVLNTEPSPWDFPRKFTVEASADGENYKEVARGNKKATKKGITTINFEEPVQAQSIIITVTEASESWWSIYEMEVKYAD
jgi:hypothetical protein